jgi:membrane-associated phospholipid phosphatase
MLYRLGHARREFLATLLTTGIWASAKTQPLAQANLVLGHGRASDDVIFPTSLTQRVLQAFQVRQRAAVRDASVPVVPPRRNNDDRWAQFAGSFSKGLPHDATGLVEMPAYHSLLAALRSGDPDDYERIVLGGSAKLANPQAALAFDLIGLDGVQHLLSAAPELDGPIAFAELVELYWRALTRDVPFRAYADNPLIRAAAIELSQLPGYRRPRIGGAVTADTVFRGGLPGESTGPFVSQLLYQAMTVGAQRIEQQIRVPVAGDDHMASVAEWLGIQNGQPAGQISWDSQLRYIRNGRDLAEWVHKDYTYQAFLNAGLSLLGVGARVNAGNPYRASTTQAGFITFGGPHLVDMVAKVACVVLKAVWFQKWHVHRRLRPEEFAARFVQGRFGGFRAPASHAADQVFRQTGTYLLPMAYPEGAPLHPSYPGGHAAIAGACATVLKWFFDESFVIPEPVSPDETGTTLVPYEGIALTLGGEVNKLASNIAFGRDTAGMHYRSDGVESLILGEAVALTVLRDFRQCFNERVPAATLTRFDGSRIDP